MSWPNAKLPRRATSPRRGVTVVEFALTFPLLLMLVIGLIEFARLSTLRHAADNAAYEAARHVIVPGANVDEAIKQANDLLARAGVRQGSISVNPSVIDEDTQRVTVQVTVPLAGNSWLPPKLTANRMVVRETTLRTERVTQVRGSATTKPIPPPVPTPAPPPTRGGGSTGSGSTNPRSGGQFTPGRTTGGRTSSTGGRTGGGRTTSSTRQSPTGGAGGGSRTPSGGGGGTKAPSGGGGGSTPPASSGGSSSGGSSSGGSSSSGGGGSLGAIAL